MTAPQSPGPGSDPAPTGRSTRTRPYAFGLLAIGGLGGLVAASRPWWVGAAEGSSVTFSGTETTGGLAQAVPFVVLAGTLLALALRARGRRAVGVLLAVAAGGGVVAGLLRPSPPRELVLTRLQAVTLGDSYQLASSAWPYVFVAFCLLVLAGAVLMVVHAGSWLTRAARFERAVEAPVVPAAEQSDAALWSALDAGIDPTEDPDESPTAGVDPGPPANAPIDNRADEPASAEGAPIRSSRDDGDTMGLSASRPTPADGLRSGPAEGADGFAAPAAGPPDVDNDAVRSSSGPHRPGSEGEQRV